MRTLIAKDIIPMGKLLSKTDLKPMLKDLFFGEKKTQNNSELAIELAFQMLENIDKIANALFEFLAHIEEKPVQEIEELPLDELVELLKQLFGDKNFGSFFKLAAK